MLCSTRTTRLGTAAGALLAVAILSGCGGGGATSPSTGAAAPAGASANAANPAGSAAGGAGAATPSISVPSGPHNATDIAFAKGMIPLSVQSLASTQIATSKSGTAQVKTIAQKISAAQVPQIETLSSWLTGWGEAVPAGGIATAATEGINQTQLVQLSKTTTGFDKLWLNTMIKHQQQAIQLAQTEISKGSSSEVKELAQKIVKEQQDEITTMKGLLKKA